MKERLRWYWLQPQVCSDELRSRLWSGLLSEHSFKERGMRDDALDERSRLCLLVPVPLYVRYLRAQGTAQETTISERRSAMTSQGKSQICHMNILSTIPIHLKG